MRSVATIKNIFTNYYIYRSSDVISIKNIGASDRWCGGSIADNFVHGTNFIRTAFLNV